MMSLAVRQKGEDSKMSQRVKVLAAQPDVIEV